MAKQNTSKTEKNALKKANDEAALREKILAEQAEEDFSFDEAEEDDDLSGDEREDEEELFDDAVKAAAFDIFDEGDKMTKAGIPIRYWIKRNGAFLCEKYPPFTLAQLQNEFKGGQYQVVAKEMATNQIKKSQIISVNDPIEKPISLEREREPLREREISHTPVAPVTPQPSFMELMTMMNQMNETKAREAREAADARDREVREQAAIKARESEVRAREAREDAAANKSESNTFMMAFLEMNKASAAQAQAQAQSQATMMLEIAKMSQAMSEKQAESQRAMSEKQADANRLKVDQMNTRFEKIIEVVKDNDRHKEKPMTITEMMLLIQNSKNEGFELFQKMNEMSELKAQERIEFMENGKTEKEEKDKPSMTERLIEGILPVVAGAMAAQSAAKAAAPQTQLSPQPQYQPQPQAQAQQRRALPKPQHAAQPQT